jgi:hypothetical protein
MITTHAALAASGTHLAELFKRGLVVLVHVVRVFLAIPLHLLQEYIQQEPQEGSLLVV